MTRTFTASPFLRRVLLLDCLASAAAGALMLLAAAPLAGLLALPEGLLRHAGIACLLWACVVGWLAARPAIPRAAVVAVIVFNLVWVLDSILLLALGWVRPNLLGVGFVLAMAAAVGGLAALQAVGLGRGSVPATA